MRSGAQAHTAIASGRMMIAVTDLDRALRFYAETLGLRLGLRVGNARAELALGPLRVGLQVAPRPRAGARSGAEGAVGLCLEVADLAVAMAELTAHGVRFAPRIAADGTALVAGFTDPDGNPLWLCQVVRGPGPCIGVEEGAHSLRSR